MYSINAIIADDEENSRNALAAMIREFCPEVKIVAQLNSISDTVSFLNNSNIDVAFLDITFNQEGEGFDILDQLRFYKCEVVFVTAHAEYTLKAFKYGAINYLMKPVNAGDLLQTIERIMKRKYHTPVSTPIIHIDKVKNDNTAKQKKIIPLPNKNQTILVAIEHIEYIEANGSYSIYHLSNGEQHILSKNMKFFEDNYMDNDQFVRIHKSYIINKDCVASINKPKGESVTMNSGAKLKVTMSYSQILENILTK